MTTAAGTVPPVMIWRTWLSSLAAVIDQVDRAGGEVPWPELDTTPPTGAGELPAELLPATVELLRRLDACAERLTARAQEVQSALIRLHPPRPTGFGDDLGRVGNRFDIQG